MKLPKPTPVNFDEMNHVLNLYVIRDTMADEDSPIFSAVNDGVAARQLKALENKALYSNELQLFHVGKHNLTKGTIVMNERTELYTPKEQENA